jgi:hypothetical protein
MKKYNVIPLIIFVFVFSIIISNAIAITPPDTVIVAGPSGNISSNDVVFWWTGKVTLDDSGRLPSIKGFYYSLDGEFWNWTQERYIAYYNLPSGSHRLDVKAVDSNDQQDQNPAFRTFSIEQNFVTEPNEGQSLFIIDLAFKDELNNRTISTILRQDFGFRGITLSTNAIVDVITNDSKWQITDGDKVYFIKKDTDLKVYGTINDSSSTAMVIPINKTVKCQNFTAKDGVDEDWFSVNVASSSLSLTPRQMTVIINRPDALVSSIVKVYRFPDVSSGQEIASFEVKDKDFFAMGVTSGTYLINVRPISTSSASSYSLTAMTDSLTSVAIWDTEENNSSNSPTETSPIFLSKTTPWMEIIGNKWSSSDNKDWYRIHANLTEQKRMSLNLTNPVGGSTTIRLYSASPMTLLGEFAVTPASSPQWKLDVGSGLADYLIEVDLSNYGTSGTNIFETPYFLSLMLSDIPKGEIWETEPNNSPDFANRLTIGTRIKASRNQSSDTDWFRLSIPRNGILSLTSSRILKTGSINIYLLDTAGQPIDSFKLQTGEQKNTLNTDISTGEYLVNTDFADFTGDYWLTATLITSVSHDVPADKILSIGDKISVRLVWEKGNSANFDIFYNGLSKLLNTEPILMYDDGLHNDGNADDGIYSGTYIVKDKDNAKDAIIVIHIKDKFDNSSDVPITDKPIVIDTIPPVINQVSHDAKSPLSIGMELAVTIKGEAGNTVTFDVTGDESGVTGAFTGLPAYDDGKHNDGSANDGVYVGTYTVKGDDYIPDGIVTGYLTDIAGNVSNLSAVIKVDIVGDHPVINSIEHTGRLTLGKDDTLTVTMIGDPDGIASFDIDGLANNIPMYDDGKHGDGSQGDGKYVGSYKVVEGDGVLSALLSGRLVDRKGRISTKTALIKVNIDAVSPVPVIGVEALDRPNDQGGYVTIKWKPSIEIDFAHYNIYLSKDVPITVSKDRPIDISPIRTDITDSKQTSVDVKVDNNFDYYVAVTAVDIMGNESILSKDGKSLAGPIQAKDNLKPTPVKVVKAVDRDKDFGGIIILSWTDTNNDEDFSLYNIYQDTKPILVPPSNGRTETTTDGLRPIDTITDRLLKVYDVAVESNTTDYYFAVTSVDLSGNESELDKAGGSVSTPIKAENNIGAEPQGTLAFISAPIGTIHYNHVAFHWNRYDHKTNSMIRGYYIRLDDTNWQWTTESSAVFYNLSAGDHKFAVRLSESSLGQPQGIAPTIERSFTVIPVLTSGQEPNNTQDTASKLITGMITKGNADDDWYRVHVPQSSSQHIMDVLLSYSGTASISVYSDQPFRQVAESESNGNSPLHLTFGTVNETDYLIHVNSSGQYRLVANISKLPQGLVWETEINDQPENSNYLTINEGTSLEVTGDLSQLSNSDWFKVHISESVDNPSSLLILQYSDSPIAMKIYTSPLETDQIGEISDNNNSFTGKVKPGADYYINLRSQNASALYQFLLSVNKTTIEPNTVSETEPNDIVVQANPMNIGVKQSGTNWDGNKDIDVFKLNIEKDGILNVQFSRPAGIGSSIVDVLNSSSQVISSFNADVTSSQKGNSTLVVKAGTYYVRIRPQNENTSSEYALVAMFVESIKLTYMSADGKEIPQQGTPLKAGDSIVLEAKWNVNKGKASFSIGIDESRIVQMTQLDNGIYRGIYTIAKGDDISNAPVTLHIEDDVSNKADIRLDYMHVGIVVSAPPDITEVSHDAGMPLSTGDILSVRMIGQPRDHAKFDITGFKNGLDMYNMSSNEAKPSLVILNWDWRYDPTVGTKGSIVISGEVKNLSDPVKDLVRINYFLYDTAGGVVNSGFGYTTPNRIPVGVISSFKIFSDYTGKEKSAKIQLAFGSDTKIVGEVKDDYGVYTGIYEVKDNDNVQNATITCYLTDSAGNQSSKSADVKVTFDNIPPIIKSLSYNADKVFVEGDVITVKLEGESNGEATFDLGSLKTGIQMIPEDSIYVGTYRVKSGDKVSGALITGHLKDQAGNISSYSGTQSISINTTAPGITSVTFNTIGRPFIESEIITVTANTETGVTATFDIDGLVSNKPMYDDGKHNDGSAGDGVYASSYTIKKGDNVRNAKINVTTLSSNGKSAQRFALETVSVDTTTPDPVINVKAIDKPNDNGGFIILSWTPTSEKEFKEYRIYQSDQFITSIRGLTPLDLSLTDANTSSIEIKVPLPIPDSPPITYYFAVTVVDIATNESSLDRGSSAGPITSIDNLPPEAVGKVVGYDREFDHGKVIVINWSQSSIVEDFHNYNIYIGRSVIDTKIAHQVPSSFTLVDSSITDRNVRISNITVTEDNVPFYFVVTAVDNSGNESDINEDSVTGPLTSIDNLGAEPDTLVRIISGPVGEINNNDVTFVWRRWFTKQQSSMPGYYYKLDDDNWVWTNEITKTYNDLREGQHTFYVKADLGTETDPMPAVRIFSIKRITIPESEPNNSAERANWISKGVTIVGANTDDNDNDWYRFHVETSETNGAIMTLHFDRIQAKGTTNVAVFKGQDVNLSSVTVDTLNNRAYAIAGVDFGDYYVLVDTQGESPDAKYELSVTVDELPQNLNGDIIQWDKESNDLPILEQLAGQWDLGVLNGYNHTYEASGLGNNAGDVDWYRIQVSGLKTDAIAFMKIDFIRPRASTPTEISLYASLPITESPKIGFISYTPDLLPVQTTTVPIKSGDYYIKVDNKLNTKSIYSLRVSFAQTSEKWELEPNNISQFANTLTVGEVIKGTSWDPDNDSDWFRVRLNERKTLVVSMFRPFGKGSTEIKLKSSDMTDIATTSTSIISGQKATIIANLNLGDYFVALKPNGEKDSSAEYNLVANTLETEYKIKMSTEREQTQDSPLSVGDTITLKIKWTPEKTITFDVGDLRTAIPMYDDGKHDDSLANDGIYSGTYAIQAGDDLTNGTILLHLGMSNTQSGEKWTADFTLQDSTTNRNVIMNIDTIPPRIYSVDHDMPVKPLSEGKILKVTMIGEPNAKSAFFNIQLPVVDQKQEPVIYRASEFEMKEDPAGTYIGSYTVTEGDNLDGGIIVCHLIDKASNESVKSALRPVSFHTTAPEIISVNHDAKNVLVDGDVLIVTAITDIKKGKATFNIGDLAKSQPMYDDGTRDDKVADDGIYTGRYTVKKGDNATDIPISVKLIDEAGNTAEATSREPISIDTTLPKIASFVHNAKNILKENDKLIVTLKGDVGHTAMFDIGEFKMGLPMYDDGTRGDDKADDGTYVGTYVIKKNDSVKDARITGYLTSKNGNQSISRIFERVSINAIPPTPIMGVNASDRIQDQGFWVILTWSLVAQNDFDHYNIYRESAPITSLLGLTPLVDDGTMNLDSATTERAEVNVPTNKIDYYFAVTVVDSAGNESPINILKSGSTFGPIQAIDNISPDPVNIVSAIDKPDDQGMTIIVSWTNQNRAEDFNHYAIYSSNEPITLLKGLKPVVLATKRDVVDIPVTDSVSSTTHQIGVYVTVSSNGTNFYFAVTAVDKDGNESVLDSSGGSIAGPVKAKDDISPKPVLLNDVVDTPDDDGGFVNVIWIPNEDEAIEHYNLYVSKQFIDNETIKNLKPVDSVISKSAEPVKNSKLVSYKLKVQSDPIYVAITAVDFGANESLLDDSERSSFGPVQAMSNIVKANSETKISAGFDSNTYIQIPADAFDNQETINILWPDDATFQTIDDANNYLDKSYIDSQIDTNFADSVRVFKASSSKLRKAVTITLSYTDVTEMTNTTDILSQNDERQFRIFRLNEASRLPRWELVAGQQKVDTVQNTISTQVNSFGVFRIAKLKLPENLDKVVVYPNPFIPSQSINGYITFKNLTENATIQIYSVDGEKVKTIDKIGGGDEATWNALNDKDEIVTSGTYIFFIQNELDTFTGKIIILR